MPTVLFNGMINPVLPYAIRGAPSGNRANHHRRHTGLESLRHVLQALVQDWRKQWGEGDFPLLLCPLPGQEKHQHNPRIREEQQKSTRPQEHRIGRDD